MSENVANVFPALGYKDATAAIDWLGRAFGLEKKFVVPGPEGSVTHAKLKIGPGGIMLGTSRESAGTDNVRASARSGVYAYVDDIDAHYQRAKAAGAEIVREIEDTDYGAREYSARDLDGNLWSFGNYLPEWMKAAK